ncbi:hypothetical protein T459_02729 [Capsicum annuum]|uniref:RNase H type-1 domain-containing protein n=1 Tax=Capsicum annuum TaxID=4072 RepID=A0A2G3AKS1_CAPAN|nr:hypothetical protein T459_02729 [Capsicum annuum]
MCTIWRNRNHISFNSATTKPMFNQTFSEAIEFQYLPKLSSPRAGSRDINVKGVVRDHEGNWIVGFHKSFPVATSNQMDLLVLLEGLKMAEEMYLVPIDINMDSKEVIIMLKEGNLYYNVIIGESRLLIRRLERPQI